MANRIQETEISPGVFVNSLSRYSNTTIIYYGDQNKITFKTYKKHPDIPGDQDRFMIIPSGMEYRPDLVSYEAYGVVDFWWRIMEVNDIKDIFDFKSGVNIRIPGNVFI